MRTLVAAEALEMPGPSTQSPFVEQPVESPPWRRRLHEVIFEADTRAGRLFDVALLVAILASLLVIALDSIAVVHARHERTLIAMEWGFTVLFTVEWVLRLLAVRRPLAYATSFFGVVDLLAILPTYLMLLGVETQYALAVRALRLMRIFRVLKLARFLSEGQQLARALRASREKIVVFLLAVVTAVILAGATMYMVEGPQYGFTSIPRSMYWAIVTMTTVGYGDITPKTGLGQALAALLMIFGYAIIAVPTGIFSAELLRSAAPVSTQACPACGTQGHDVDARFCKRCGAQL